MADADGLLLRVFTHSACSSCTQAVKRAWTLAESHSNLSLRTVSLAHADGLTEAQKEGVKTIPTLILSQGSDELERWVGAPATGRLEAAIEAAVLAV